MRQAASRGDRPGPVYGVAVWGWGLWTGAALWAAGFLFLPWWGALLLWWWPSALVGALIGLLAVSVARWLRGASARRPRAHAALLGQSDPAE